MHLNLYTIKHINNSLSVFALKEKLYSSSWFMDFGKFGCEIFNSDKKKIYFITKKFQFWKWKMVYTIKSNNDIISDLISQNNRKTIYAININNITYEIKIHYKKKISIYKNELKIAELDESNADKDFKDAIKLVLLDTKDLEMTFLIYACIKIGETHEHKKALLTSQKQLEVNTDPWI